MIISLSVIGGLYLFEIYFLYNENYNKNKIYKEYNKNTGKIYDKRFFTEVFKELEKKEKNLATASVTPSSFLDNENNKLLPLSGVSKALTLNCNENGYYSFFKSDKYGFNNENKIWENDIFDMALLGDSFVMGNCVRNKFNIKSNLNSKYNTVVNLGYAGNGPLLNYAIMREYLPKNVKKVLWFFYEGNDLSDLNSEKKNEILLKYLKNNEYSQNLKKKQNEIDSLNKIKITSRVQKSHNFFLMRQKKTYKLKEFIKLKNVRRILSSLSNKDDKDFKFFLEVLKNSKKLAEGNGSEFYFVYLPGIKNYKNLYSSNDHEEILLMLKENNIQVIDIKDIVFDNETEPLKLFPFKSKGHYNEIGYKKVSEAIINYLGE